MSPIRIVLPHDGGFPVFEDGIIDGVFAHVKLVFSIKGERGVGDLARLWEVRLGIDIEDFPVPWKCRRRGENGESEDGNKRYWELHVSYVALVFVAKLKNARPQSTNIYGEKPAHVIPNYCAPNSPLTLIVSFKK